MGPAALTERLRAAGCVFAEEEAERLIGSTADAALLEERVARRVAGEPLEHVLGEVEFCGLRLAVRPGVFVPRQRTAYLARLACAAAEVLDRPVVVDLCCGTGAIAAVVGAHVPGVVLHAADVDPVAVAVARENLAPYDGQVGLGDLYDALPDALRGRVDVLAVNAPYVPSREVAHLPPEARDHEPRAALDGGPDGLDVHRRVAAAALDWLAPGGLLLIETSTAQAPVAADVLAAAGLRAEVRSSEELYATVVTGAASP